MLTSDLKLRHYSHTVVKLDTDYDYRPQRADDMKPIGFWVTTPGEDDWPTWCKSEDFRLHALHFEHEVTLKPTANVRVIRGLDELDAFAEEHRTPFDEYHWSDAMGWSQYAQDGYYRRNYLDWTRIKQHYDGVIITPYLWARRDLMWYYGWDVASGCIWNLDAIQSVKWLIPELVELQRRIDHYIDVAFEQFENRIKYGTDDPTGGRGRQLYRLDSPLFPSAVSETRPEEDDDDD
jgi:hypothetical protein